MRHGQLSNHDASGKQVNTRIAAVGTQLGRSLSQFLESIDGAPHRPHQLAADLKINKDLAHRLITAVGKKDPFAVVYGIPGPEPLRRVVKAGLRHGAMKERGEESLQSIDELEHLIREIAGERASLDAIICNWLPDARKKFESTAKQSAYRGMRQLKGIAADLSSFTILWHPSQNEPRHDIAQIRGFYGLSRVRPEATFRLAISSGTTHRAAQPLTLDGTPVSNVSGLLLENYCTGPAVQTSVLGDEEIAVYSLDWGETVGIGSARDIVMGELRRSGPRQYCSRDDPKKKTGFTEAITVPSKKFICDLIMHQDVYPDWEPSLRVLEASSVSSADPNSTISSLYEFDVLETFESMGVGIEHFRAPEIPGYTELLLSTCARVGWDPSEFRGYRVRIDYPIFSSQIQVAFDLPIRDL